MKLKIRDLQLLGMRRFSGEAACVLCEWKIHGDWTALDIFEHYKTEHGDYLVDDLPPIGAST